MPALSHLAGDRERKDHGEQADVFYRDDMVFGMVNSKFSKTNPGHIILVTNTHIENIYDLPDEVAHRIAEVSKKVAIALKEVRKCDGVKLVQNNEPASGQHAFHYHLHIIPRFDNDGHTDAAEDHYVAEPFERMPYAEALRTHLAAHPLDGTDSSA